MWPRSQANRVEGTPRSAQSNTFELLTQVEFWRWHLSDIRDDDDDDGEDDDDDINDDEYDNDFDDDGDCYDDNDDILMMVTTVKGSIREQGELITAWM